MNLEHTKTSALQNNLSGEHAFFNKPDYEKVTKDELSQSNPLEATYTYNTESKIYRIAKQILSIIIFPIGIYHLLHALAGKVVVSASSSSRTIDSLNQTRASAIEGEYSWKYKRITIEVDGYKIDATIMGKASTLGNGRWVLPSIGNGEFAEDKLVSHNFKQILSEVKGNAIVFNYPGVGVSSGLPNKEAMAKAYRAMLTFLEDQENGIGAKEIIGFGHSIGGGVQGEALKTHELKRDVKYVFVKSRTFSDLSTEASLLVAKPASFLIKMLGWNLDSVESSKNLKAPEIIMQTASVSGVEELNDSSKIRDDGVILGDASLAKVLLDDEMCPRENKVFLGIKEKHNTRLLPDTISYLADKIEKKLKGNSEELI